MAKTRVLIVDDDVNLSRLSAMILENSGEYEVVTEKDSTKALALARRFKPEVMLLDINMPHLSGGDIAKAAAADPVLRDAAVIFLTGLVTKEEAGDKPMESGGMSFLAKPVLPEVLLSCVAALVPGKSRA